MKKFVSLCAFVVALSFVSCGGNTASNATTDSVATADSLSTCEKGACDTVNKTCCIADSTKVGCCKGDSLQADSAKIIACEEGADSCSH